LRGVLEIDLKVELVFDNLAFVKEVLGQEELPWASRYILLDCRELMAQLGGININFEQRESKGAVDWVAQNPSSWNTPIKLDYLSPLFLLVNFMS